MAAIPATTRIQSAPLDSGSKPEWLLSNNILDRRQCGLLSGVHNHLAVGRHIARPANFHADTV
jgi:hypothetical protein